MPHLIVLLRKNIPFSITAVATSTSHGDPLAHFPLSSRIAFRFSLNYWASMWSWHRQQFYFHFPDVFVLFPPGTWIYSKSDPLAVGGHNGKFQRTPLSCGGGKVGKTWRASNNFSPINYSISITATHTGVSETERGTSITELKHGGFMLRLETSTGIPEGVFLHVSGGRVGRKLETINERFSSH